MSQDIATRHLLLEKQISLSDKFRGSTRKTKRRLVTKNGQTNIRQPQTRRQRLSFLQFTKLVDSSWKWTISVFLVILLSSWLLFALVWWLICYTHGDFEPDHLPPFQKQNNFRPCLYQVYNFASCLLFSIETQHTVGYGVKATTDECPEAIFVNALQCIIGFIMQGFMAVIVFAKMTLPRLRSKTLLFSKFATICLRNGQMCLMFRIGDMRKTHIIDVKVRAYFVRSEKTLEGEIVSHKQTELLLGSDDCHSSLFFNWPLTMIHKIDETSPLYWTSPSDLLHDRFEIIVVLEGTMQSTGQMTQAVTSYVSTEILWGRKFLTLMSFNSHRGEYEVDFSKFDEMIYVRTPLCSAAYINEFDQLEDDSKGSFDVSVVIAQG